MAFPRALNSDQTLFDTVFHSAAVVGLNTSAELEAGIVGRPVFTILAGEHAEGQQGTIHFQYLLKERGGFVEVAPDFEAHRRQFAAAVRGEYRRRGDPGVHRTLSDGRTAGRSRQRRCWCRRSRNWPGLDAFSSKTRYAPRMSPCQ